MKLANAIPHHRPPRRRGRLESALNRATMSARRRPRTKPIAKLVDRVTAMFRRLTERGAESPQPTKPADAGPAARESGVRRLSRDVAGALDRLTARRR